MWKMVTVLTWSAWPGVRMSPRRTAVKIWNENQIQKCNCSSGWQIWSWESSFPFPNLVFKGLPWILFSLSSSWDCISAPKGRQPCFTPGCCKAHTFHTCSFKSWISSCFSDLCRLTQVFYKNEEKAFPFLLLWHYREGLDPLVQCSSWAKAMTIMDMD